MMAKRKSRNAAAATAAGKRQQTGTTATTTTDDPRPATEQTKNETHTVAMTDPQLNNNNNNNNNNNHNNNNNDGEPKYLHKKFKKMATTEAASAEPKREVVVAKARIPEVVPREEPKEPKEPPKLETSPEPEGEVNEGRKIGYVCPYCKLSCAKPSVLQKHIRAHTNERPYPCVPCGFAFKTRSNLYKHCRSRAHALAMESGDSSKVSEDSDISLSDSASNGTGTPPPPSTTSTPSSINSVKTVKTGKIYKPKFHTALNSVNHHDVESSSVSSNSSTSSTSTSKPNAEQLQEHIDKIITDNQAIVDAVDPRLHKLMQRQQSLVEPKYSEQPLNLCSAEESSHRKRCYSESFALEKDHSQQTDGSIIKDLLLKTKGPQQLEGLEGESLVCPACKISYTSVDNLETHRMYYCKGSPSLRRPDFQIDLEKKEMDFDVKSDYYNTLQPLPSPGPLLGNTRLVDAYVPPAKQRSESAPTTLRSLEELSKYPRPNSLQMFGGEVRILDNTGETKTMRIEPRQTNSPNEHVINNRCSTAETSSVVVKSSLHSGGTMVHKPPGTPVSTPSCSISLPNTPKMLAPIMPNISTPNIAPTMSCYSYLEANLNPLTSITAYNPLTLPQAGIASILHGGKVIPYVPGMPGPHTLSGVPPAVDVSTSLPTVDSGYKVIPGIPGLHVVPQPLDLASPVKPQTPNVPGIPGPHSNMQMTYSLSQPLDLASPAKEFQLCFKTPSSDNLRVGLTSPKVPNLKTESPNEKNRRRLSMASSNDVARMEQPKNTTLSKCKNIESPRERREFAYDKSPRTDKSFVYPNGADTAYGKARYSPKTVFENRKRSANWTLTDSETNRSPVESPRKSPVTKFEPPPQENGRTKVSDIKTKLLENYGPVNEAKIPRTDSTPPPIITVNLDSSKTSDMPNDSSPPLPPTRTDKPEAGKLAKICENYAGEEGNTKFLRPTSLPLKPGTFTPKRHHGITPTSNTLPLISPETPRPRKSYGQLYLNGHAYTYLGLKCSTRLFYCTLNRPQPMYVTQQHGLSMYSNWKICKEAPPDLDMAHYDSRHRPVSYTIASTKQDDIMTHSSQRPSTPANPENVSETDTPEKAKRVKIFDGGFESNEDYIYVRGRGRGRYVCEECGIRCKKPSMLKKHIRTHTDVRPYTCKHCTFSFKTKGNLTKHMKSKAHYKKCVELGVTPVPTLVCDENIDKDAVARLAAGGGNADESSEEEDESDGDESEESGSEEHEAAQGLLSLSQQNSNRLPGLLPSGRPTTYPYTLTLSPTSIATTTVTTASCTAPLSSQAAAVIQSELSHRYYFPSNRCSTTEKSRGSVIQSSKKPSDADIEVEVIHENDPQCQFSQPMDLTTKQIVQPIPSPQRLPKPVSDILTPVSEPGLLHTIVQTMERLPIQGREWKSDAQGHMLQAYLTERHVMDSKMKQQYRVGNSKLEKGADKDQRYLTQQDTIRSRNLDLNGVPTVTYTDPSRMHQHALIESRIKLAMKQTTMDAQMEVRDKMYHDNAERRSFEVDPVHNEDNFDHRGLGSPRVALNPGSAFSVSSKTGPTMEHGQFTLDLTGAAIGSGDRLSPRLLNAELINRTSSGSQMKSEIDRSSMFNAMKMMSEMERPRECHSPNSDARPPSRESRLQTSRSQDPRPSGSEVRIPSQDYRSCGPEVRITHNQDLRIHVPDARPPAGQEFKPVSNHQELRPQAQEVVSLNTEPRSANPEARSPVRDARPIPSQESRPGFDAATSQQLHEIARVPEVQKSSNNEVRAAVDRPDMKQNNETRQSMTETIKHSVARKMVVGGPGFRSPSPPGGSPKPQAEFLQPSSGPAPNYVSYSVTEDGRSVCGICNKVFSKPSQLRLHINIHYFERPFRCESCAVSFRTKGHLTKHERSVSHHNKVSMTSTFGAATTSNPRPFKCTDCKIAFRIHGHLAKHLRSKMHIMKLECLGKLPFGTYAEMERSGINLNDIDTSDCDNSLTSLQNLAQKLYDKDPSKMGQWDVEMIPGQGTSGGDTSSDEGEPIPLHPLHQYSPQISLENETARSYHMPILVSEETKPLNEIRHANPQFTPARSDFPPSDRQQTSRVPNDESITDDTSQMYKCHICSISIRTLSELQAHRFVEHNVEADSCAAVNRNNDSSIGRGGRDKDRTRRLNGENILRSGRKRQVVDDT